MTDARRRIYLDHAATSWPKSDAVLEAMDRFARQCGAAAGRGGYASAAESDQVVSLTRRSIANLIGAESSACISLHSNGTAALNAAIHGILRRGDHVVATAAEHNSVLRPLHHLQSAGIVTLTVIPTDTSGAVDASSVLAALRPETRLVSLTHASNVTGYVQPIAEVGHGLQDHPATYLCDAAQTFGVIPINVRDAGIDLLAAPGHKASGGPLGTGFLYATPGIAQSLQPSIQGGTGSQSESLEMPTTMPSKMEAGNLNVPALAGWNAALAELAGRGIESRIRRMGELNQHLYDGLMAIEQVVIHGRSRTLPIASVSIPGISPTDIATVLDVEFGIETRAGLHCAALIHGFIGSEPEGTLRISAGHETPPDEIQAAITALRTIAEGAV